jgi:hypothetical protein
MHIKKKDENYIQSVVSEDAPYSPTLWTPTISRMSDTNCLAGVQSSVGTWRTEVRSVFSN